MRVQCVGMSLTTRVLNFLFDGQAVMLLKASLQSSTALTDVFSGGVSIDTIDG